MSKLAIRILAEPARELGFAAIGAAYMGVGTATDHPCRLLLLQNLTDTSLMVSFDGIEDHIPMAYNGYLLLDIASNKTSEQGFYLTEGQRFYVRQLGVAATSGSMWVTVFYGASV